MNKLLFEIEELNNQLDFENSKLQVSAHLDGDIEQNISTLKDHLLELNEKASEIKQIQHIKDLIYRQLTAYIDAISKNYERPFSKSQGLSFPLFYIAPQIAVRNILFSETKGIEGAVMYTTENPKDAVKDKQQFLNLLRIKQEQIIKADNLLDLYHAYRTFSANLKNEFLAV